MEEIMDIVTLIVAVCGAIGAAIVTVFSIRKLYGWIYPIKILPTVTVHRNELGSDKVIATLVNRCREPVYVASCRARSVHPIKNAIRAHIKHPFSEKSRLQYIYGFNSYEIMTKDRIKLEPDEPVELSRNMIFNNSINRVPTNMLVIEVVLSSGKTVRSQRFSIPKQWTLVWYLLNKSEK